ncbi:unnamed protein product [Scytosiphon promiscuus]
MPLTRKQQWRRVRIVRHENALGEARDHAAAGATATRCKRPAGEWTTQPPQQHASSPGCPPLSSTRAERSDSGSSTGSSSSSGSGGSFETARNPDRNPLENWRLPKEGREPSARPGVCAARRQANAACVRVGSRVSFNTVVAAILIPSAKDLHAAARKELWWQETDYRDFRINFIQFMRTPPAVTAAAGDGPELVPVEIVAESESTPVKEAQQETTEALDTNIVQQPVIVDVAAYEGAPATQKVRAWPVPEEEAPREDEAAVPANASSEQALSSATAAAVVVAAAAVAAVIPKKSAPLSGVSDTDTSPPSPPSEPEAPARADGGESDDSVEAAVAAPCPLLSSNAPAESPQPACDPEESSEITITSPASPGRAVGDGSCSWPKDGGGDNETSGGTCSLGWSSPDEGNEADEEEEDDDDAENSVRSRRSFSNLETARRGGAGLTNAVVADDSSDGDDSCDGSVDDGGEGHRPRALSLDGWFTCGLENGVNAKSYETHDHAGRLRDLVRLNPIPAVCATPPQSASSAQSSREVDLNDALRRLGVTFNVKADSSHSGNAHTEHKVHVKGGDAPASLRKGASSPELSAAAAISNRKSMKVVTSVAAQRAPSSSPPVVKPQPRIVQ